MNTIEELISFYEAIPEENWCTMMYERIEDGITKRCSLGHLNHHLCGEAIPNWARLDNGPSEAIVNKLGFIAIDFMHANNGTKFATLEGNSPKSRMINFLKLKQAGEI